ncbi:hypothetical protein LSS_12107 [Leptospira santarosai serovar Shermani str. LT 821]|uniref:Uncharacterized protein n=1 Tax=Leptospira santarosai serovar Shermani str. LT 821 TaxID=758847 RepID=K8XYP9_9LEPT|nr:hypothetical protein LSS_12107 [Leptospira santarosai serovar Shermani str. LT 821]
MIQIFSTALKFRIAVSADFRCRFKIRFICVRIRFEHLVFLK